MSTPSHGNQVIESRLHVRSIREWIYHANKAARYFKWMKVFVAIKTASIARQCFIPPFDTCFVAKFGQLMKYVLLPSAQPTLITLAKQPFKSPTRLSPLEQLPSDLMTIIASYLTVQSKCYGLLPASRSLLASLNMRCFSQDRLSLAVKSTFVMRTTGLPYMQFVRDVSLVATRPAATFPISPRSPEPIADAVKYWISQQPNSKATINVRSDCWDDLALLFAQTSWSHQAISSLDSLSVTCALSACSRPTDLSMFRSLHSVCLVFPAQIHEQGNVTAQVEKCGLAASLPFSITKLVIVDPAQVIPPEVWQVLFGRTNYLPNLIEMQLDYQSDFYHQPICESMDISRVLALSHVQNSGKSRPVEMLHSALFKMLDLPRVDRLTVLSCDIEPHVLEELISVSPSSFRQLRALQVNIVCRSDAVLTQHLVTNAVVAIASYPNIACLVISKRTWQSTEHHLELNLAMYNAVLNSTMQTFVLYCGCETLNTCSMYCSACPKATSNLKFADIILCLPRQHVRSDVVSFLQPNCSTKMQNLLDKVNNLGRRQGGVGGQASPSCDKLALLLALREASFADLQEPGPHTRLQETSNAIKSRSMSIQLQPHALPALGS